MATFHPFRFLRNLAIVVAAGGLTAGGFLWWHTRQVGLPHRVENISLEMPTTPLPVTAWQVTRIDRDFKFKKVTRLQREHDGRLYLLEQKGKLFRLPEDLLSGEPTLMLKLGNVAKKPGEGGLLGFALHPQWGEEDSPNRRHAYVYYSADRDGQRTNRLSRFTANDAGSRLDRKSELILIDQEDENHWHDGGALWFGTDGFLYALLGDEGGSNDQFRNSQTVGKDLFSGVIRIDVDERGGDVSHPPVQQPSSGVTANYMIPTDNPFVGVPGALEEFWALGFRNPHDVSVDAPTGRVFVTDIGQNHREELNLLVKGGNYGWSYREGERLHSSVQFEGGVKPDPYIGTERGPILAYPHTNGNKCIIGGFVYRGAKHPELSGKYIFGDLTSGRIWALTFDDDDPNAVADQTLIAHLASADARSLCALAEDANGDIYAATLSGQLHRLKLRATEVTLDAIPTRLSETGVFADMTTLTVNAGFIPYAVNSPLWSDGSIKRRWISVPGDGTSDDPLIDRVYFHDDEPWDFPAGTCFVKHFDLPLDESDPTLVKRLETRLIMRDDRHGIYGVTYEWNDEDTEAFLVEDSHDTTYGVRQHDGTYRQQVWSFPSRMDCLSCHTEQSQYVLGVNTRQLNGWTHYPETGRDGHQLRTWNSIGLLTRNDQRAKSLRPMQFMSLASLVDPSDATASLDDRVMSYFDSNCAHCHRPYAMRTALDLRWGTDDAQRHLFEQESVNPMDGERSLLADGGAPDASELLARIQTLETGYRMPPLASSVRDEQAIKLIRAWLRQRSSS